MAFTTKQYVSKGILHVSNKHKPATHLAYVIFLCVLKPQSSHKIAKGPQSVHLMCFSIKHEHTQQEDDSGL